jgi:hypothetical protein
VAAPTCLLRSISDAEPDKPGVGHCHRRCPARIRDHYLGALAHGADETWAAAVTSPAVPAPLITRFGRYQDMILWFATDPTAPCANNESGR